MVPMKTKHGTATSTRLSAEPPQMRGMMFKNSIGENRPTDQPIRPKDRARPPRTKATGKPENSSTARAMNMYTGR
jgi:hypothetical protein